jgi:hypothetical protein
MRVTLEPVVEKARTGGTPGDGPYGAFNLWCPVHERMLVVVTTDGRFVQEDMDAANTDPVLKGHTFDASHPIFWWEHVSVSGKYYTPNWAEMCWVKDQFWLPEEVVVQFHVPPEEHINIAKTCLHLWRLKPKCMPIVDVTDPTLCVSHIPRPPGIAVGPTDFKPKV